MTFVDERGHQKSCLHNRWDDDDRTLSISMRRKFRYFTVNIAVVFLAAAPLRQATATVETLEQARADEKLFSQVMEMQRESSNPGANDQVTLAKLGQMIAKGVRWENTDVQAALADLAARTRAEDPNHVGIHFLLDLPSNASQPDKLGRQVNNNVCIVLSKPTSLFELLGAISEQTNLAFRVQNGMIIFRQWKPGDCFYFGSFDR